MGLYKSLKERLQVKPKVWLVTGAAGFIGSNLCEELLNLEQKVVGLDNFITGKRENLDEISRGVGDNWRNFKFLEGSVEDFEMCLRATVGVDIVLHQAALGSVPRSIKQPIDSHNNNVNGFINMLLACEDNKVKRLIFASSSSVYGSEKSLPKVESRIGKVLSPYAATKRINEVYMDAFSEICKVEMIGLRYFNVFGRRQDPEGVYSAVIPRWIRAFLRNEEIVINGDGETSRDFCYIDNVIQANLLAGITDNVKAFGEVFNCAYGEKTTLNDLFYVLKENLITFSSEVETVKPRYEEFRKGDVRHSLADISKARDLLGYAPQFDVKEGLNETLRWYVQKYK